MQDRAYVLSGIWHPDLLYETGNMSVISAAKQEQVVQEQPDGSIPQKTGSALLSISGFSAFFKDRCCKHGQAVSPRERGWCL